jgi:co-chaperonin GroES (HSP10)
MTLKLFGSQVVIQPDEVKEEKTASGLFIPQSSQQVKHFMNGTVVAFGEEVSKVKAGDKVFYSPTQAGRFDYNNEEFDMVQESSLIGVYVE